MAMSKAGQARGEIKGVRREEIRENIIKDSGTSREQGPRAPGAQELAST